MTILIYGRKHGSMIQENRSSLAVALWKEVGMTITEEMVEKAARAMRESDRAIASGRWNDWDQAKPDHRGGYRRRARAALSVSTEREEALRQRVNELETRLEMNFAYVNGKRVPMEPGSIPDGIECRDETIKGLDERIERIKKERDDLVEARRTAALDMRERAAKIVEEEWDHGDLIAAAIRALEVKE